MCQHIDHHRDSVQVEASIIPGRLPEGGLERNGYIARSGSPRASILDDDSQRLDNPAPNRVSRYSGDKPLRSAYVLWLSEPSPSTRIHAADLFPFSGQSLDPPLERSSDSQSPDLAQP